MQPTKQMTEHRHTITSNEIISVMSPISITGDEQLYIKNAIAYIEANKLSTRVEDQATRFWKVCAEPSPDAPRHIMESGYVLGTVYGSLMEAILWAVRLQSFQAYSDRGGSIKAVNIFNVCGNYGYHKGKVRESLEATVNKRKREQLENQIKELQKQLLEIPE